MPYIIDDRGLAQWVDSPPAGYVKKGGFWVPPDGGSGSASGGSTSTSGSKLNDPNKIYQLFLEYGLDPYMHFDGSPRTGGPEALVGKYTEAELRGILAGAPADSPARTSAGATGTDITKDPTPDTPWTTNDVELIFAQYGLDPAVNFDGSVREGGADGLAARLNSGELTPLDLHTTLANFVGTTPGATDYGGGDLSPAPDAAGGEGVPGVWSGGQLVRIQRQGAEDKWAMIYTYGDNKVAWEFDSYEQMLATIGDPSAVGGYSNLSESNYNNNVTFAGNAAEIQGPGSFTAWIRETINNVALDSGVADPTLWGQYMADPAVQSVLFKSAIEGWSEQQTMAEIRKTDFYQNTLFPGITSFYNTDDPEREWYQYMANVRPVLEALGVEAGPDGYRSVIGDMLNSGVSDQTFVNMSGIFMRAATSQEYASALDEWFQIELGKGLDFDTFYSVLAGEAEADVRDVVNKAVLEYQSQQQGADLTNEQIARIAERRPAMTDSDAAAFLNQFLESTTAVRDVAGRYGLNTDELLSAAAGIETPSGRSIEEIQRLTRQAAGEAGRLDDEKIKFFLDFTAMGTPRRPGLSGLAPESG